MRADITNKKAQLLSKKEENKNEKKNMEFSKKWLIACMCITVFFTLFSFILAIFDKNTASEVSVAIIQTLWSSSGISFGGYIVQNCVRAVTAKNFTNIINNTNDIRPNENGIIITKEDEYTPNIVSESGGEDNYDYR